MPAQFSMMRSQLISSWKLISTRKMISRISRKVTTVSVSPAVAQLDEDISVKVSKLAPGNGLSLQISLETETGTFLSPRHLCTAGPEGQVQLGPATMALLSCMQLQGGPTPLTARYYKSGPMPRQLSYSVAATVETGEVARADLVREVYGARVRRLPLEGAVRGTLFLPDGRPGALFLPDGRPRLGVLCIGGAGGVKEDMAAYLAQRGHPALALGYFGLPGLPRTYSSVSLEYLEQATDLLAEHCQALQGGGVGVLGQSKGGDLALALAVTLGSKIRAVATLNGCIASAGGSITHSGRTVFRGLGLHPHFLPRPRLDGSLDFLGAMQEVEEELIIPVEKAQAEILMIAGEDDRNWDSVRCSQKGRNHVTVETIPGLGHRVDLPFTPVCTAIRHAMSPGGAPVYMGGEDRATAGRGQARAMNTVIKFFSTMQ